MSDDEKTYPIATTNAGAQMLRTMVSAPDWAKGPKQQRKAIRLVKKIPKLIAPSDAALQEAWAEQPAPVFDITERDRDIGKVCLAHFSDTGRLPNNEHIESLFSAFGVVGDD